MAALHRPQKGGGWWRLQAMTPRYAATSLCALVLCAFVSVCAPCAVLFEWVCAVTPSPSSCPLQSCT